MDQESGAGGASYCAVRSNRTHYIEWNIVLSGLCSGKPVYGELAMGGESLLIFLLVGLIAGWLASQLVRGGGFGLVGDLVVGVIGAFIAGYLFPRLGISLGSGLIGAIIAATIGAVILLFILRAVKRA
jgi:uncharacterized membrane protein YeaQ/YmgE (transglycosylase-associated protein family)